MNGVTSRKGQAFFNGDQQKTMWLTKMRLPAKMPFKNVLPATGFSASFA